MGICLLADEALREAYCRNEFFIKIIPLIHRVINICIACVLQQQSVTFSAK